MLSRFVALCLLILATLNQPVWSQAANVLGENSFGGIPITQFNDLPPFIIPVRPGSAFFNNFPVSSLLNRAPNRLWYTGDLMVSNGLNTNIFQTINKDKAGYIFNVAPDFTLGYNLGPAHLSAYATYRAAKLLDAEAPVQNYPTPQSVSIGLKQILFSETLEQENKALNINFEGRQTWSAAHQQFFQMTPSIQYQYVRTGYEPCYFNDMRNTMTFTSSFQMPLIMQNIPFSGNLTAIRPTYSIGVQKQVVPWIFSITPQFTTNYALPSDAKVNKSFQNCTLVNEIQRVLNPNGLSWFLDANPLWYGDHRAKGRSGFGFQLMTGFKLAVKRTPVNQAVLANLDVLDQRKLDKNPPESKADGYRKHQARVREKIWSDRAN